MVRWQVESVRLVLFDRGWLASRVVNRGAVPVDAEYVRFWDLERFPNGKHDDQVDVVACGFNELAKSVSRPGVVVSGGARRPSSGAMAGRIR